jgi:hypothetical protein
MKDIDLFGRRGDTCNLKTMSNVFLWMKAANPISTQWLSYWQCGDSMALKNLFSDLFLFLVCFVV